MQPIIAPSILSSDFADLKSEIEMINASKAGWIHVDVMDGVFVPNISIGIPVVEAIKKHASKPLDVHLMIVNPDHHIESFCRAGASLISIHIEAGIHLHRSIRFIKKTGCKAGVALNPHTPISSLENILHEIDLVCVMSVNPGFSGQQFIENTYKKVEELKKLIDKVGSNAYIEVDGGINQDNAQFLIEAGADVLVAGSFIFSSDDPKKTIYQLSTTQ